MPSFKIVTVTQSTQPPFLPHVQSPTSWPRDATKGTLDAWQVPGFSQQPFWTLWFVKMEGTEGRLPVFFGETVSLGTPSTEQTADGIPMTPF